MLKVRRGTDAERATVTFADGEPVFTTDLKQWWVGDGSTLGGILVGGYLAFPQSLIFEYSEEGFSGNSINLPTYTFPDPGSITESQGNLIFDVFVGGQKLFYKASSVAIGQFHIDDVTQEILFPISYDDVTLQIKAFIV